MSRIPGNVRCILRSSNVLSSIHWSREIVVQFAEWYRFPDKLSLSFSSSLSFFLSSSYWITFHVVRPWVVRIERSMWKLERFAGFCVTLNGWYSWVAVFWAQHVACMRTFRVLELPLSILFKRISFSVDVFFIVELTVPGFIYDSKK